MNTAQFHSTGRVMQPTMGLRFVERTLVPAADGVERSVRVLQQAWAPMHGGPIEWRDVPMAQPCNCTAYCSQCMPQTANVGQGG